MQNTSDNKKKFTFKKRIAQSEDDTRPDSKPHRPFQQRKEWKGKEESVASSSSEDRVSTHSSTHKSRLSSLHKERERVSLDKLAINKDSKKYLSKLDQEEEVIRRRKAAFKAESSKFEEFLKTKSGAVAKEAAIASNAAIIQSFRFNYLHSSLKSTAKDSNALAAQLLSTLNDHLLIVNAYKRHLFLVSFLEALDSSQAASFFGKDIPVSFCKRISKVFKEITDSTRSTDSFMYISNEELFESIARKYSVPPVPK